MNAASIRLARFLAVWLIVTAASIALNPADAQEGEKPDAARAVTTAIPDIPVDELELLLAPLAKHELADEAEGWHALLKAKVFEMSAVEIAVKRKNIEIEQVGALAELVDEALEPVEDPKSEPATGGSKSVEKGAEDRRSPEEILVLAQESIEKIAAFEARDATDGAVATAVRSAAERARRTLTPQDTGTDTPAPAESDVSGGRTKDGATAARDLFEAQDLEELRKKTAEVAQAKESVRAQLFEDLDALRDQRNAIIERAQVVLDEWKAKGGTTQDHELYIEAVNDVNVDTADTVTTWTTMVHWVGSQVEALAKRLSGGVFDIIIMVLLAIAVWIAVKVAVKRHMGSDEDDATAGQGEGDGGGPGATRVKTLLPLLQKFITITLIVFVVMISLSSLGVDVAPLLAGAGMVGIAIGFGAQTLVRDVMSGFFFLLDDAFRMGEYVEIDAIRGAVERISVRSLQLRHHNGPVHTIPFGEIRHLTNYSRDYSIMKFEIRLPFDADIDKVRKIIKKTGQEMMEDEALGPMMLGPLKSQGVNRMDDSALIVRCKFTAKPGEQFVLRREAYMRIQQALAEAGIHFAPRRVIVETASSGAGVPQEALQAAAGSADAPASEGAVLDKRG